MSIATGEFEYLRKLVKDHSAIEIDSGKEYLAESRLSWLVRETGCNSLGELLRQLRLQSFNGLHRKVLDAMTNNETWFFRDLHPFNALRDCVLPELMRKRARQKTLSIWSAASSTGQEAYSIAMLWRENFNLPGWRIEINATDISLAALDRAQTGIYSQLEVNRGLPVAYLTKYFSKNDLHWELHREVTRMVEFRQFNLATLWIDIKPMDVIFLRNVLIYFDIDTRQKILRQVRRCLRQDGYLCLGGAETTLNLDPAFTPVRFDKALFYRVREGEWNNT